MISIGLVGALLSLATLLQGWRVDGSFGLTRVHVLLALAATLLLALSQCWTALFLVGAWRSLARGGRGSSRPPWLTVGGCVLAVSLMVVNFVLGFRVYSGEAGTVVHMILGIGAVIWIFWSLAAAISAESRSPLRRCTRRRCRDPSPPLDRGTRGTDRRSAPPVCQLSRPH